MRIARIAVGSNSWRSLHAREKGSAGCIRTLPPARSFQAASAVELNETKRLACGLSKDEAARTPRSGWFAIGNSVRMRPAALDLLS
jgi:hypothetical protein